MFSIRRDMKLKKSCSATTTDHLSSSSNSSIHRHPQQPRNNGMHPPPLPSSGYAGKGNGEAIESEFLPNGDYGGGGAGGGPYRHHQHHRLLKQSSADRLSIGGYENGILTDSQKQMGNGTLLRRSKHSSYGDGDDSWNNGVNNRDSTSPESMPPGMPAFRVIPLCESESSGTHLSEPMSAAPGTYATLGGAPPGGYLRHSGGSAEIGSNGILGTYPASSEAGSDVGVGSGQPLLRRNQYWV